MKLHNETMKIQFEDHTAIISLKKVLKYNLWLLILNYNFDEQLPVIEKEQLELFHCGQFPVSYLPTKSLLCEQAIQENS